MELLIHPTTTLFPAKYSFTTLKKTNQTSPFSPNSYKFPLHPPVLLNLPRSSSSRFRIYAHFGRPTNRQNYLRKKLTQHQQVRESLDFSKQPSGNDFGYNPASSSAESLNLDANSQLISKSELLRESVNRNKLDGWVDQYRKDIEYWGIGTKPIFTVFQDSKGNVQSVAVDEDEILRRSGVDPKLYNNSLLKGLSQVLLRNKKGLAQVNSKILSAKTLAIELKKRKNVLPHSCSVVKYVSSSSSDSRTVPKIPVSFQSTAPKIPVSLEFTGITFTGSDKLNSFRKVSRFGVVVVCAIFVLSAIVKVFTSKGNDREEYTRLEKEMLGRKIKARLEKEKNITGDVEIVDDSEQHKSVFIERPPLDKEELMKNIMKAKTVQSPAILSSEDNVPVHFNDSIQEIRVMARHARELEKTEVLRDICDEEDNQILKIAENSATKTDESIAGVHDDIGSSGCDSADKISHVDSSNAVEIREQDGLTNLKTLRPAETSVKSRFRIIQSVKEAREYLAEKHDKLHNTVPFQEMSEHFKQDLAQTVVETSQRLDLTDRNNSGTSVDVSEDYPSTKTVTFPYTNGKPEIMEERGEQVVNYGTSRLSENDSSLLAFPKEKESDVENIQGVNVSRKVSMDDSDSCSSPTTACEDSKWAENETISKKQYSNGEDHMQMTGSSSGTENSNEVSDMALSDGRKKWIEKNFHELGPVIEKIGFGFQDNYMVAKEKTSQDTAGSEIQMMQLLYDGNGNELEWMQDKTLREIVFKVRDNELSGKDPFYSITEEEKLAFFDGLEKKVELENAKLQNLHEWLHSNIENLDYGTDGISVYDPPEKVIPRWKGPPVEKIHEFLKGSTRQPEAPSDLVKQTTKDSLSLNQGKEPLSSTTLYKSLDLGSNPSQRSRITIEGSDGSIRAGKKSGKEYWQHTKKWSRGFLESYNAETDPEIKSVMKDVGKDLDRWITDKEIKEAGELMDRLPEKGQKFIKKKLDKVKREMELFGPQAVVEKYREYSDEKEKDYLWWLDLPFVLCIEMYTEKEGDEEVGFYSLEMAADLELDPKQYHVIAFEDAGDCKNMCYIIQAHLEMLGNNGTAFVVAQRPKDAFRDAKANGFGVTVVRKGELKLNVDQTLEEVEEMIAEIGSKMYQEKIMGERSLDVSSMMKGVFGLKKPAAKRKRWRKLNNKPTAMSTSPE